MNWESSIEIYILPYAKLIASGKLLYNTGSSTQCSMTTYRSGTGWGVRRMFRREGTYAHLWLIHIVVRQKPTQHRKAIILQLKVKKKNKRICLPMQGTGVRSLVQEDFTCHRATKPICTTTEPPLQTLQATTTEAHTPQSSCSTTKRTNHKEEPTHHNQGVGPTCHNQRNLTNHNKDPAKPKINQQIGK